MTKNPWVRPVRYPQVGTGIDDTTADPVVDPKALAALGVITAAFVLFLCFPARPGAGSL